MKTKIFVLFFMLYAVGAKATPLEVLPDTVILSQDTSLPGGKYDLRRLNINPNGHEYVDLGLPSGLLWSPCNIGANSSGQCGNYYSWGSTVAATTFPKKTYSENPSDTLSIELDAAHVTWGGDWRMPTKDECEELQALCNYEQTTYDGKSGYLFTGINGNLLFFPYTGYYTQYGMQGLDNITRCWTSTQYGSNGAWRIDFFRTGHGVFNNDKYLGQTIRPVMTGLRTVNICLQTLGSTKTDTILHTPESVIFIVPQPKAGYRFIQWVDGNNDNPRKVIVKHDTTFTAIFAEDCISSETLSCTIINESPYGAISFTSDVVKKSNISLQATATECSHFVKWSDNNTDNPRSVTVTQDSTFTAIFEKIQYKLSIDLNDTEHGDIEAKETNE